LKVVRQILQKYHRYIVEQIFSIFYHPIFQKGGGKAVQLNSFLPTYKVKLCESILILPVISKNKTIGFLHIVIDFVYKVNLRQASIGLTL
jgi:hypothetical protein